MYNLFNRIISYARNNDIKLNELYNDKYVEASIKEEYEKYIKKIEDQKTNQQTFKRNEVQTVVDDLFPKNNMRYIR